MRILGIETSCDETAAAIVTDMDGGAPNGAPNNSLRALSSVVSSQVDLHAETGGVVPEVAARAHLAALVPVIRRALAEAECSWDNLDAIAVTAGPGLPGALVTGFNAARGLAYARNLPLIPVDHIEGHVCANWLEAPTPDGAPFAPPALPALPALALIVSGGHTELLLMDQDGTFERLGGTRDDAAGEAFDKVARLLDLPYPGGPPISQLAATATIRKTRLPRAWMHGTDDFSFSGLKTAVATMIASPTAPPREEIAWAFEEAVCDVLARKTARAVERLSEERAAAHLAPIRAVLVAGGVAANRRLRERVREECARLGVPVHIPPPALCTDNGAMIAAAAFHHLDDAISAQTPMDIFSTAVRRRRTARPAATR